VFDFKYYRFSEVKETTFRSLEAGRRRAGHVNERLTVGAADQTVTIYKSHKGVQTAILTGSAIPVLALQRSATEFARLPRAGGPALRGRPCP